MPRAGFVRDPLVGLDESCWSVDADLVSELGGGTVVFDYLDGLVLVLGEDQRRVRTRYSLTDNRWYVCVPHVDMYQENSALEYHVRPGSAH